MGTKTNVRKPSGLSKNMSFANVRKLAGISKTCVLGTKNKCQESRRALKQPVQEFCAPKANVGAVKKNTWVLGTKNKCQENHWALKKAWDLSTKTNVRKSSGVSKNMSFGHQQQMSGNSLGSQKKKTCVLGAKNKYQETRRAFKQPVQEFCAPKANVGAVKKKNMSLGHQKQMSGNPLGSQKSMSFGVPKQMSGNLLGSPELCILGIQEIRLAFKKHEFWAPLKKPNFSTKKQISVNPPGSFYMNFGQQNKCQETFWALQKHEFCTPTTNVRKLAGISKKTWVLGTKNKGQETRRALKKHEFWNQKTNVRKPAGLFETIHEFWAPKQMSGNLLGSQKNMSFGHQQQMSGNSLWSKTCVLGAKTNVRKLAGLSNNVYKSFVHQKQMSGL